MPLDFPQTPYLNEIYTFGGRSWIWNGTAWDVSTSGSITPAGVSTLTGTTGEVEVSGLTGDIVVGLPNNVTISGSLTVLGNINTNGYFVADGSIITKTGFYGYTGNASEEPVDFVDLDGGDY